MTSLGDAFRVRTEEEIEQEDEDPKDVEDGSATSAEKISQISYHVRSFVNCNGKHTDRWCAGTAASLPTANGKTQLQQHLQLHLVFHGIPQSIDFHKPKHIKKTLWLSLAKGP